MLSSALAFEASAKPSISGGVRESGWLRLGRDRGRRNAGLWTSEFFDNWQCGVYQMLLCSDRIRAEKQRRVCSVCVLSRFYGQAT